MYTMLFDVGRYEISHRRLGSKAEMVYENRLFVFEFNLNFDL